MTRAEPSSLGLTDLLPRLAGRRIAVVGDVCLDEYIVGRAVRLSREAPIPVLEFTRRFTVPGGAANPARNVRALGSLPSIVSVVGDDAAGRALCQQLAAEGIDVSGIVIDPSRETTLKTRILAEVSLRFPQQVARVDHQDRRDVDERIVVRLAEHVGRLVGQVDAVLVSDYQSGVVTSDLAEQIADLARAAGRLSTADTQGSLLKYRRFGLVKANQPDTERFLGSRLGDEAAVERAGRGLLERLEASVVVVTRASDGIAVIEAGACYHVPTYNRTEVYDTTGAGDTVIAVMTQALAAGAATIQAATLANIAAGLVVRKLGNATISPAELAEAISRVEALG